MKNLLLILVGIFMPLLIMAQETKKIREIGLVFSNLNNFGLTYKIGSNQSLWRFNTLFISGSISDATADSSVEKQNNIGFGFKFGREYRKNIVENLELRFGADLSFTYTQSKYDNNDKSVNDNDQLNERITYEPGINLIFGMNYVCNNKLVIGAELLPYFSYTTGTSKEKYYYFNNGNEKKSDISGFSYRLSNTSALLYLAYRF